MTRLDRQGIIFGTKVLGTILVLPILVIAYVAMWVPGLEDPGYPAFVSSLALLSLFLMMPLSVVVLLFLYRSFKRDTTTESFRIRVLVLYVLALAPSLLSMFVSFFSLDLVEPGKIIGIAFSLLAYAFTLVFSPKLLDELPGVDTQQTSSG